MALPGPSPRFHGTRAPDPMADILGRVQLRYDTISFLSDYGHEDEFVGVVKSVIGSVAPAVNVVDITHSIAPYDIRAGGLAIARSAQYLMPGVVLAVVDPGVGTARRRVAVEVGDGDSILVGPDNGLLAPAVALVGGATRAFELTNTELHLPAPGPTFDGRDVFAPVAAHLCAGVPLEEVGTELDTAALQPGVLPVSERNGDMLTCEVLWIDRFGNLQLNIDVDDVADLGSDLLLRTDTATRGVRRVNNFSDITGGSIGLLVDSYGLMAVAVARGSAAAELGVDEGAKVTFEKGDTPSHLITPVELGRRE